MLPSAAREWVKTEWVGGKVDRNDGLGGDRYQRRKQRAWVLKGKRLKYANMWPLPSVVKKIQHGEVEILGWHTKMTLGMALSNWPLVMS